jgi:hypothetical protein
MGFSGYRPLAEVGVVKFWAAANGPKRIKIQSSQEMVFFDHMSEPGL